MSHEPIISNFFYFLFLYFHHFISWTHTWRKVNFLFFLLSAASIFRQTSPFFFFFCLFSITWCCYLFDNCYFYATTFSSFLTIRQEKYGIYTQSTWGVKTTQKFHFINELMILRFITWRRKTHSSVEMKKQKAKIHLKCRSSILIPS